MGEIRQKRSATQLIESTEEMFRDSRLPREVPVVACSVVLQGVFNIVASLVDTLMIGTMGAIATVAVGPVDKFFFVLSLLIFGIASESGMLAVQPQGNGGLRSIRKVPGLSILPALIGTLLFVVPALVSPQSVMHIFTTNHGSAELGSKYLKIAVLTYPFLAIANVYVAILKVVNKVIFPVISSYIAIVVNICLSYVLIFNKLGIPAMEVSGVVVATLIARITEIALILGYVYGKRLPVTCGLQDLFGWNELFISRSFGTSTPVITSEFMQGLGTTVYSLTYGRMGDEVMVTITVVTTVQDMLMVLFQSLSTVTAAILGNELRAGHLEQAEKYAMHLFILQFTIMIGTAVVLTSIHWPVIGLYDITPEVIRDISLCILIFTTYIPTKIFDCVNTVGMLRGGGGTRMCLSLDTGGMWFIDVSLMFLGALMWRLPTYTVYVLVMVRKICKAVLGYIRCRQKKWLRSLASDVG